MKNKRNRVLGYLLTMVLVAGLLPVHALAVEPCAHENLVKGVCQAADCEATFAAKVGDTLYETVEDAIAGANEETPAIYVLTDLKEKNIELNGVYLVTADKDGLTFENCSITGNHEQYVIYNVGKLTLKDVTVENTNTEEGKGTYALYSEPAEDEADPEVSVLGGSYIGKGYGIGLKDAHMQLGAYQVQVEEETTSEIPHIAGATAAFHLTDSAIDVLCDLGEDTAYSVDVAKPGVFAYATEYNDAELKSGWFTNARMVFENKQWVMPDLFVEGVSVDKSEFTYNGEVQIPAVTVKLEDETLEAGVDYTLSYSEENPRNVGDYTVTVEQVGTGSVCEKTFSIKPASLTVVSATADNKSYDGTKNVAIQSVVLDGVIEGDDVSVAVSNLKGEVADSKAAVYSAVKLPELTLAGQQSGNYTLTQPTEAVETTVTISKADIPAALADIKTTVTMTTENLVVENLGKGMPTDAGNLQFTTKNQSTAEGTKVIVLDWGVDSSGKLTSKLAAGAAGDKIVYEVTVSSDNYKDAVVKVEVSMNSIAVDAAKLTITPEATELTYNRQAQKPAVTVKYDGATLTAGTDYDVTYPADTTNVGEKELTVQFKGSYSGSATAKYTIKKAKVSVTGVQAENKTYDGTTKATVTATYSGVISGDDVKVTATGIFADKNSGNKTIHVTYALSGKDIANYELASTSGTTTAKISPVSASALNSRISGISGENADSSEKSTLQSVANQANAALEDTGLSAAEKTNLSNVKYSAEDMIKRIENAAAASATESIRKSAGITKENVKTEDKALLEKAQSDISNALTTYSGNYTSGEKSDLQKSQNRIADALNVITRVQSAQTMIASLPNSVTEETVVNTALKKSLEDAQLSYDSLNEYEKSLLGEETTKKLSTVALALDGVPATDDAAVQNTVMIGTASPEKDDDVMKLPTWILVFAVICAAVCGGGLFWYKRKQEENEYNW